MTTSPAACATSAVPPVLVPGLAHVDGDARAAAPSAQVRLIVSARKAGRPTDFERGARLALYTADLHLLQGELFPDDQAAALRAEWQAIFEAAQDALAEAVTCRQQVAALEAA